MGRKNIDVCTWRDEIIRAGNIPPSDIEVKRSPSFWRKLFKNRPKADNDKTERTGMYRAKNTKNDDLEISTGEDRDYSLVDGSQSTKTSILAAKRERLERAAELLNNRKPVRQWSVLSIPSQLRVHFLGLCVQRFNILFAFLTVDNKKIGRCLLARVPIT